MIGVGTQSRCQPREGRLHIAPVGRRYRFDVVWPHRQVLPLQRREVETIGDSRDVEGSCGVGLADEDEHREHPQ